MTNYQITIGYKAVICVDVKALNEEDAKQIALEKFKSAKEKAFSRTVTLQDDNYDAHVLQPCDSWLLRRLRALDSQFCKAAVIGWLRSIQHKTQIEAQKKIIKNSEAWAKKLKQ